MSVAADARLDAVTYQVLQSRLSGIVQEMQENIFRTGYSTIIRESQDASCMILDAAGDVIGEHVVLPLHVTCLPEIVRAVIARFDDLAPGDAYITNHPYLGGVPHSMDMAVVAPVFVGDRLVAFCGSIAHKSDLGGVVAGTANGGAREIFQEGIQYPPVRLVRAGAMLHDVEAILRANSRTPDLILGDIRGQIGVARLGERRLRETIERYGLANALEAFARKQGITEARMRAALASWPDAVVEASSELEIDDGARRGVRFHVRVEKAGDRITFDFTGSDDDVIEPINIRPPLVRGCIAYALIATIDPALSNNGGVQRVVETRFRPGSIVDPAFPAPTNSYMPSALAVTEACLEALSAFAPERRMARVGGFGAMTLGGARADGSRFVQYELAGSAYGGRNGSDGPSGIAVLLSNARSASIEILESEFPSRVRRFELIPDSGGAGAYRGGLAARREVEVLAPDVQLSFRGHGHRVAAAGREGGADGKPASVTVNPGTSGERAHPARFSGVRLQAGDRVRFERGGGGGLGDPRARPFERVVDDVADGYVSRAAAVGEFGADPARLDAAVEARNLSPG
jgi:N-methylhydantoinase B